MKEAISKIKIQKKKCHAPQSGAGRVAKTQGKAKQTELCIALRPPALMNSPRRVPLCGIPKYGTGLCVSIFETGSI
jgi:hypothetical protein